LRVILYNSGWFFLINFRRLTEDLLETLWNGLWFFLFYYYLFLFILTAVKIFNHVKSLINLIQLFFSLYLSVCHIVVDYYGYNSIFFFFFKWFYHINISLWWTTQKTINKGILKLSQFFLLCGLRKSVFQLNYVFQIIRRIIFVVLFLTIFIKVVIGCILS